MLPAFISITALFHIACKEARVLRAEFFLYTFIRIFTTISTAAMIWISAHIQEKSINKTNILLLRFASRG